MSQQEYKINGNIHSRGLMHEIKERLRKSDTLKVISYTRDASSGAKVCETLRSLGYVNITNIRTTTEIEEEQTKIKLIITLEKTPDFDKLYNENEEKRKQFEAERNEKKAETKEDK